MISMIQCAHCGCLFTPDPRVKNQRYCGEIECRRVRKRKWQKKKLREDPDYKENQRQCQRDWHRRNPEYYRKYRKDHPRYCQRNKLLQSCRNARARPIAKMDALKPAPLNTPGAFYLIPVIAKMDASVQKIIVIPMRYVGQGLIAKDDSIAFGNNLR